MAELRRLSKSGTRLWILKALKDENPGAKINPRHTVEELIRLFEVKRPREEIMNAMMSTTNGDLAAACTLGDHLTEAIAVRFLYESIEKIVQLTINIIRKKPRQKVESGGFMGALHNVQYSGRDSDGNFLGSHRPESWPDWKFRLLLWGSSFLVIYLQC